MGADIEKICAYLDGAFQGKRKLKNIFHTFEFCSKDPSNNRFLVDSRIRAINFDRLTQWLNEGPPQSADAMTFSGVYVYLIEFKSGDQLKHETKKEKLIGNVIGKINDSENTIYARILPHAGPLGGAPVPLRFYLVVDMKEMGITPLAAALASLSVGSPMSADPKIRALLSQVLPDLKAGVANPNRFDQIDIWYSELFDTYLTTHKITDIGDHF